MTVGERQNPTGEIDRRRPRVPGVAVSRFRIGGQARHGARAESVVQAGAEGDDRHAGGQRQGDDQAAEGVSCRKRSEGRVSFGSDQNGSLRYGCATFRLTQQLLPHMTTHRGQYRCASHGQDDGGAYSDNGDRQGSVDERCRRFGSGFRLAQQVNLLFARRFERNRGSPEMRTASRTRA